MTLPDECWRCVEKFHSIRYPPRFIILFLGGKEVRSCAVHLSDMATSCLEKTPAIEVRRGDIP